VNNIKKTSLLLGLLLFLVITKSTAQVDFNIRTITAGITLENLSDTLTLKESIAFLEGARKAYEAAGYTVQTIRISSQHLHELLAGKADQTTIVQLQAIDQILVRHNVSMAMGELVEGDTFDPKLVTWFAKLIEQTANLNFSVPIASKALGVHDQSIELAAEICHVLAGIGAGGEANFRFTASANVPSNIPFFPAAFHQGERSFALGLESPKILSKVFAQSTLKNAAQNLRAALNQQMKPLEVIAEQLAVAKDWHYDGIDTSPAPGLEASIGEAIETLTGLPFGSPSTLRACSIITGVLKNLEVKTCGYSGLMLPVIEDKVLAKRNIEGRFTIEELLLYSTVSGTGLDVVPIPGDTPKAVLAAIYADVAALSLKYTNKALSVRLFPIPGKQAGELVEFKNPYLTGSTIMKVH